MLRGPFKELLALPDTGRFDLIRDAIKPPDAPTATGDVDDWRLDLITSDPVSLSRCFGPHLPTTLIRVLSPQPRALRPRVPGTEETYFVPLASG